MNLYSDRDRFHDRVNDFITNFWTYKTSLSIFNRFLFFRQYVDIGIQGNEDNVRVIGVDAEKCLRQLGSFMGPLGVIKVVIKQNT